MTAITLALAVSLIFGQMSRYSASAESELNPSTTLTSSGAGIVAQSTGVVLPKTNIYVLNADNTIFVLTPGAASFTRLVRVTQVNGNLIGIGGMKQPDTTYRVTIDKSVTDVFDQQLGKDETVTFTVGPMFPRFALSANGFTVLDPAAPRQISYIASTSKLFA